MQLLITGAGGQLGAALVGEAAARSLEANGLTRADLDVCDVKAVKAALNHFRPDTVINATGSVGVKACEQETAAAWRMNVEAVRNLAAACRHHGARFVTISTDYVFGQQTNRDSPYVEEDCPGPIQFYGVTKLAGEYAARAIHPEGTLIIRTCGLYGGNGSRAKGGNFVLDRIRDLTSLPVVSVSSEQISSPSYCGHVASRLLDLLSSATTTAGIYHLANEGALSWCEFTLAIREALGLQTPVKGVDRHGLDGDMRRPFYSALTSKKLAAVGVLPMPGWRQGLSEYLSAWRLA